MIAQITVVPLVFDCMIKCMQQELCTAILYSTSEEACLLTGDPDDGVQKACPRVDYHYWRMKPQSLKSVI